MDTTKRGGEVSEETATRTYMTTKQFIEVWKSLDDDKRKELSAAWYNALDTAWYTAWGTARAAALRTAWYNDWYNDWHTDWYNDWYNAWDTAWNNAWNSVRDANLAVLVRDKITTKQFEILTQPWTSCQLSLFAEDWQRLQQSEVEK